VFLSGYVAPCALMIWLCSVIVLIVLISLIFLVNSVAIFDIRRILIVQHVILILESGRWGETAVTIDMMFSFLRRYLAPWLVAIRGQVILKVDLLVLVVMLLLLHVLIIICVKNLKLSGTII
jgi:hypothetical protein